jgi:ribonuclease-3
MALDRALGPHVPADPVGWAVKRPRPRIEELEERLGYRFEDGTLLGQALTHVSAPGRAGETSYQRLEFLGDRVLGLAVAELLYARFPVAHEGELSRRLSEVVRRESCAAVAEQWEVGPYLKLGLGEVQSGGRRNQTILADVCEAIIAAVFLDGGYPAALTLVDRSFGAMLSAPRQSLRDPKSALQEWAQGRGLPPPTYELVEQTGPDHAPSFQVMVKVQGLESGLGAGTSKRGAEQEAARGLLLRVGVWKEEQNDVA